MTSQSGSVFGSARSSFAAQITLSDTAEQYLAKLADALVTGSVELWQLPPSLMAFYTYAHTAGVETGKQSQQSEIDRLNAENDRLYMHAYNTPEQRKRIQQNRVDEGLAAAAAEFFSDRQLKKGLAA